MAIIQLHNIDGRAVGLYEYNLAQISEDAAVLAIEEAIRQNGNRQNPLAAADQELEAKKIFRIFAGTATTCVI